MARKKDSPQKAALRELMGNYLKENNVKVKDGTDFNSIMRDMMSIILEGALDQELDEELGYTKYDYRNKETDNSSIEQITRLAAICTPKQRIFIIGMIRLMTKQDASTSDSLSE